MPNLNTVPTLKEMLFKAATAAYPDGALTISDYPPGHAKLAARRLLHAHVGVRILFATPDGVAYAVAGMLPLTATEADVSELVARLADDKRRAMAAATPVKPV